MRKGPCDLVEIRDLLLVLQRYSTRNPTLLAQVQSDYESKPQSKAREIQLIFIADALCSISGVNLGGNITVEGYHY